MGLVVLFLIGILQVVILNVCVEFQTQGLLLLYSFITLLPLVGIISMVVAFCSAGEYRPSSNFYCSTSARFRPYVTDNEIVRWLTKEKW